MDVTYDTDQPIVPVALEIIREAKRVCWPDGQAVELVPVTEGEPARLGFGNVDALVKAPSMAQLMTAGTAMSDMVAAFELVRDWDGKTLPVNYTVLTLDDGDATLLLDEMYSHLDSHDRVVLDIETSGDVRTDMPWETKLLSMALNVGGHIFVLDPYWAEQVINSGRLDGKTLIGHNMKYDVRTLNHYYGAGLTVGEDTMLMYYAGNHGTKNKSLFGLAQRFFGAPDWEAGIKKYTVGGAHYENIPWDLLCEYNAGDVYWTARLLERFEHDLENDPPRRKMYRWLVDDVTPLLMRLEDRGVGVDLDYFEGVSKQLQGQEADVRAKLPGINLNSPIQVKAWLAEQGVDVPDTSEPTLKVLRRDDTTLPQQAAEFIDSLLEYRGIAKLRSTYVDVMLTRHRNSVIYPTYNGAGTSTGRLSSQGPNIQNQPRGPLIRTGLVPRKPGNVIVAMDYSQAELRTIAELSNDSDLLAAFQPGAGDFFDNLMPAAFPSVVSTVEEYTALKERDPNSAEQMRANLKGVVYGLNYGRGVAAIAEALGIPKREAQGIVDNYLDTYRGLAEWRKRVKKGVTRSEYAYLLTTPFNRQYQAEVVTWRNRNTVENSGLAFPPQSTANDICLSAAVEVDKRAVRYGFEVVGLVHDAIYAEGPPDQAEAYMTMAQTEMMGAAAAVFHRTPFVAEGKVTGSWA